MTVMIKSAVIQKHASKSIDAADIDLGELAQPYSLIPPGEYDVVFVKAHSMKFGRGKRLITYWKIQDLSSEYHGTELIMGLQYPKKGKKWGTLSKMTQCYRIAVGRDPDQFDTGRVSINVFKKKLFRAQVVTVTKGNDSKGRKQDERSPENHYSVIQTLLALNVR